MERFYNTFTVVFKKINPIYNIIRVLEKRLNSSTIFHHERRKNEKQEYKFSRRSYF